MPRELMLVCLIAFNLTVMVYGFYRVFTRTTAWNFGAAMAAAGIALLLGLAVAGITYVIASRMNR
jgi:hypothetical protein